MTRTRIAALFLTLLVIVPMLFLPNSLGFYIRDPKNTADPDDQSPVLGLFEQRTFSLIMLFVIEGFYYFFLIATLFPTIFLIIWSSLVKWRDRAPGGRLRRWFIAGKNDIDALPAGVPRQMAFPLVIKSILHREKAHPDVSLIIPCYNEEQNVARAIENAFLQDYPGNIEIIVVDDGSLDNTLLISRILSEKTTDRNIIALHKSHGGKASALNHGLRHASGKIIITTDGDSHFGRDCVTNIVDEFKKYPKAGIIGGFVLIRNTADSYLVKLQQMEYILTQHAIRIPQSEMGNVLIEPGPVFGIRADVARRYPCLTRTCCEDVDLTQTVLGSGHSTRTAPGAVTRTEAPTNWRTWYNQRKRWIYGQYQSWRENSQFLKRNPWGLYTYFTWLSTFITLCILVTLMAVTFILLPTLYINQYLFVFISVRMILVFSIYFISRVLILSQYEEGKSVLWYLPFKIIYDMINSILTAVLYFRFISGLGVKIRWGGRTEKLY